MLYDVIAVFVLKFLDCTLSTCKSVLFYRQRYILSAMTAAISSLVYMLAVVKIVNNADSAYSLIAVVIATFLGSWLPPLIHDKLQKDKLLIFEVTSDTLERGKEFADLLRNNDIPVRTSKTYDKHRRKTLSITVYSQSREVSRFVLDNIPNGFKWVSFYPKYD